MTKQRIKEELKKIWYDTLTDENKVYSRKSLTWLVSFILCLIMAVVDQFTKFKINDVVFFGLLGMATGQSIASLFEKKTK